jgi:hypothetical protein
LSWPQIEELYRRAADDDVGRHKLPEDSGIRSLRGPVTSTASG